MIASSGSIARARPELKALVATLEARAAAELGFTLVIPDDGGVRSHARQVQLYQLAVAAGDGTTPAYPVATPGHSRHEVGAAVDLDIVAGGHNADGSGTLDDYRALAELSAGVGLMPGYFFARRDEFHHQLDEPLATSIAAWEQLQTRRAVVVSLAAVGLLGLLWSVTQ